MMERPPLDAIERLLQLLGHHFTDRALLMEALTHRSYLNETADLNARDNERFEFLGDAVIDLIVSTELMRRHPDAREGALSRLRASIVSETALARLASALSLGDALRLGRGEELSGGRTKPSLLADAFEALVAAVYLDAGIERTREVFITHLQFPEESLARDPKTEIQQRLQAERRMTPTYRVVEESGPEHSKMFEVEILVGEEILGRGRGRTKKEAEQQAAATVLAKISP